VEGAERVQNIYVPAWMFDNRPHDWVFDTRRPRGWYPDLLCEPIHDGLWMYWNGREWLDLQDRDGSDAPDVRNWAKRRLHYVKSGAVRNRWALAAPILIVALLGGAAVTSSEPSTRKVEEQEVTKWEKAGAAFYGP
jgi:hypothetical protein